MGGGVVCIRRTIVTVWIGCRYGRRRALGLEADELTKFEFVAQHRDHDSELGEGHAILISRRLA